MTEMTNTQIPRGAVDAAARALGNHINVDFDVLPADEQHQAREAAVAALNAAAPLIIAAATGDATAIYARVCSAELIERLGRDGLERLVREVLAAVRKAGVDEPAKQRVWRDGEGFFWDEQPDGRVKLRPNRDYLNKNLVLMFKKADEMYGLSEVTSPAAGV